MSKLYIIAFKRSPFFSYLIIVLLTLESECYQWQSFAMDFAQDLETSLFKTSGQVIWNADQVGHDSTETRLSKTNQNIVLANDTWSTLGEIESQRSLICSQVAVTQRRRVSFCKIRLNFFFLALVWGWAILLDVENQIFGKIFLAAPDAPSNASVAGRE